MNEENGNPPANEWLVLTGQVVAAYLKNHTVSTSAIPSIIDSVFKSLKAQGVAPQPAAVAKSKVAAISIQKSVTPDHMVCMECGKPAITLKRHLMAAHGLSPDDYRSKWKLPAEYPMVAPAYAQKRSEYAKQIGLGKIHKPRSTN